MKRILGLIVLLVVLGSSAQAQTKIRQYNRLTDTLPDTESGPNMKRHKQIYMSYGVMPIGASEDPGADIVPFLSNEFQFGYRYKRKLASFFAVGFDLGYSHRSYRLDQDSSKVFPTSKLVKMEKITYDGLQVGLYMRFNFDVNRGNYLGNYLDLGGYAEGYGAIRHITKEEFDIATPNGASRKKTVSKGLVWSERYAYGAQARLGFGRFIVYGSYRLSDLVQNDVADAFPEMSRLTVGLGIGF